MVQGTPCDFTTAYSPSLRPPQQQQSASHIASPAQPSTCSLRAISLHRSPLPPPFSSPPTSLPCREILAASSKSGYSRPVQSVITRVFSFVRPAIGD
jgi:hypothetical protein